MLRLFYSLILLCLLSVNTTHSQTYNFKNFSVNNGLTQSEIFTICEDLRGDIWLGSLGGGLIKFNGFSFVSYREEDGLANNFVRAIYEDKSGLLWIGTEAGICTFNGYNFKTLDDANGPGKTIVRTIIQDKSNNFWFGTENKGLYKYNGKTFINFSTENKELPDNTIYCLYEDPNNNIWVGTNQGACLFNEANVKNYSKTNGLAGNTIRAICEDRKGNVWFAAYEGGISCFDGTYFTNYTTDNGLCSNTVFTAYSDKQGRIWFGTADGVSVFNGNSFNNYFDKNGLPSNVVVCIYEDSEQDIWFGTSGGGISKLDNKRFVHYLENEKMGRQVYALAQAHNQNMLFATSAGGLTIFDGKNYSILKGSGNFTSSKVKALYYDQDSSLWIGTLGDGIYKFNSAGFTHFTATEGLTSNNISGFTADTAKNIWIASLDSGVYVLFKNYRLFNKYGINDGLLSNNIEAIAADRNGNVWLGSDKGLNKITLQNDTIHPAVTTYTNENGLSNDAVRSVAIDKSNNVYIGTAGGGINILNGSQFTMLTKKNGLFSNNIYLLIFDNYNNLWAGSDLGVDRITFGNNFTVDECRHYGKNEGFTGIEVYRNACFKDKKGNLWFGTVNGATVYNTQEDIPSVIAPKLHITGIKLFFDNIEKTTYVDSVSAWYPIPYHLALPYNKNSLTFSFVGIYHRNPEAVRYKWKLEGLNDEWSPALTKPEAIFSNLLPGRYTFKVISCNEYNVWNKDPLTFEFCILPPFWQRWWFRGLALLLFVLAVYIIFQIRLKQVETKNRIEKEKLKMEKNIIELEQEAARLQMNPHFIFNSLNSIQGCIAANNITQARHYLVKFARLMRLILENAREKFIPLKNEIDVLNNYLELEKLSKNNKFDFNLNINKSIDIENTEIPPMMIQPFVENAIVHGIKNKEGQGLIEINVNIMNSLLVCEIIDNGVGRQKSAEIKAKSMPNHKSAGMLVTSKRLEQLKFQTSTNAGYQIIDLKDEYNNPLGTKVIVSIPFEAD